MPSIKYVVFAAIILWILINSKSDKQNSKTYVLGSKTTDDVYQSTLDAMVGKVKSADEWGWK